MVLRMVLTCCLWLCSFYCMAKIMIARSVDMNPFLDKTEKERRILGSTYFSAEAGRGFFSTEGEQAWNIKFQAHIEFFRLGNRSALGLNLSHELHANPLVPQYQVCIRP
jgi:hypothetical protein